MTSATAPLIALINATPAAISPAQHAIAHELPDATVWNLLDDRLLQSVEDAGGLTPALQERMGRLIDHAVREGADGILLTCSVYGVVAEHLASVVTVPVVAPDDDAITEIARGGYTEVLALASQEHSREHTVARLHAAAARADHPLRISGVVADNAARAAAAGDRPALLESLRAAVADSDSTPQALLLAQYSLTPVQDALAEATGLPVFSGPRSAARALRARLYGNRA